MGQCCSSDSRVRGGGGTTTRSPTHVPVATSSSPSDLRDTQQQQQQYQQKQQEEYPQEYESEQDESTRMREMNSFMINSSTDDCSNSLHEIPAATKRANEVNQRNGQDRSSMSMKNSEENENNSLESSFLFSPGHLGYNSTAQVNGAAESDAGFYTTRSPFESCSQHTYDNNYSINSNKPYHPPSGNIYQCNTSLGINSEPFPASEAFISCRSSSYIPSTTTSARQPPPPQQSSVLGGEEGGIALHPYILPRPLLFNPPTSNTASERAFHSCHSLYTLGSLSPQPSGRQYIQIPQTGSFSRTSTRTSITHPIISAREGVVSKALTPRGGRTAPATSITTTTSSVRGIGMGGIIPKPNMRKVNGGVLSQRSIHTPGSSLTLQEQKYQSYDGRDTSMEESALFHSFATASDHYVLGDTPLQSLTTTTQQEEEGDLLLLSDASLPPPPQSQSPLPPPPQLLLAQQRKEKQKVFSPQPSLSSQPSLSHHSQTSLATSGVSRSQRKPSNSGVTTGSLTSSLTFDERKSTTTKTQRKVPVSKQSVGNGTVNSVKKRSQPVSNTLKPSQSTATSFAQSDSFSSSKSPPKGNTDTLVKRQGSHKKTVGTKKLSKQEENRREEEEKKEEEEGDRDYSRLDPRQSLVPLLEEEEEYNVDQGKDENGESEGGFDTVVSNETCNPEGTVMLSSIGSKTVTKWSLIRSDPSEEGHVQRELLLKASLQEEGTPQYDNKEREKSKNKKRETLMQEQQEEEVPEDEENREVDDSFLIRGDEGEEEEPPMDKDNEIVGDSFLIRGEEEEKPVEDKDNRKVDGSFLIREKEDDADEADNQQNADDKEEEEEEEEKEEEGKKEKQQEEQEQQKSSGDEYAKEEKESAEEKERSVVSYRTESSNRNLSPARSLNNLNNDEIVPGDSLNLLTTGILGNEKEVNMNINNHCNSITSHNSINNKDDVIAKMNDDKANISISSKANNISTDTRGETPTNEQNENEKLVVLA
ncbi:hypothetical protein LSM04_007862 [Trypanosoma melophagium]|uniref:uncharacterized protein n=1 Tax=Trypanosoma melophagium TaxID=715481 RepID=UPI00351A65AF|nr:hypothetical protein LSM04_007862 [Trypanosoma melophagium]